MALTPKADAKLALQACISGNGRDGGAPTMQNGLKSTESFPLEQAMLFRYTEIFLVYSNYIVSAFISCGSLLRVLASAVSLF